MYSQEMLIFPMLFLMWVNISISLGPLPVALLKADIDISKMAVVIV